MWSPWSEWGPAGLSRTRRRYQTSARVSLPRALRCWALALSRGTEGSGSWASGAERLPGPSRVTAWPPPSPVSRPPLAPNAQGTGSGGASPWPGGVLGMLLGELQTTAPPCMLATCGGDSPKRHSSLSSSLRAGRGLTVRCTCGRATQLTAGLLCPASGCRQPPAPALSPGPLAVLRPPSCPRRTL